MIQREIQFFWPLTEQIPLDLDYTVCERPKPSVSLCDMTTISIVAPNTGTFSWSQRIGDWEIQSQNETPSKLKKFMTRYLLGWKWMGK